MSDICNALPTHLIDRAANLEYMREQGRIVGEAGGRQLAALCAGKPDSEIALRVHASEMALDATQESMRANGVTEPAIAAWRLGVLEAVEEHLGVSAMALRPSRNDRRALKREMQKGAQPERPKLH